jgi:putative tryptophan/tyrosine transport system substrate-binding protein
MTIKRREFITLLGGAAAARPLVARAQQPDRVRRVGVLINLSANDAESPVRVAVFSQGLRECWIDDRNIRIDYRWGGGDPDRVRKYAAELFALAPDVILVTSGSALATVQNTTHGTSGKWLELLKQIAPSVTRAAVIRDPSITSGTEQLAAIQAVAPSLGVELTPVDVRDTSETERAIAVFARGSNGGLIVTNSPLANAHRELIITLTAQHRLPAVYPIRSYVTGGGLISYGPDPIDPYRPAAGYVDRILKGAKPADLPVMQPTKFDSIVNLKTAKTLGLDIPATLLAQATEVIE